MTTPARTPLEGWISRKIGLSPKRALQRHDISRYQLAALNHTLAHARRHSPFYRKRLGSLPLWPLSSLEDLTALPFTTVADLRRDPLALLCVSRDRIARAVTLASSGTTGHPKRLFFTEADLALTVDFFQHGMATLVAPGQRVLILMPGTLPGSVGDLLVKALARMDVPGIVHGPVNDPEAAIQTARQKNIDCLVGIPVQVLAMARHAQAPRLAGRIRTILLSTDYVPGAIVSALQQTWGSRVFKHYGMTEMGLGGAVECAARNGCHFREADLLVEIVDPRTGQPVADGTVGEIVFTTLTREGMPLIRYRTGDLAAFKAAPCPCGTVLRTLGPVRGRGTDQIPLGRHGNLMIGELDEALFSIEDVLNYHADIHSAEATDRLSLFITSRQAGALPCAVDPIRQAVLSVPAIRAAREEDLLEIHIRPAEEGAPVSTGTTKRRIQDLRERKIHP